MRLMDGGDLLEVVREQDAVAGLLVQSDRGLQQVECRVETVREQLGMGQIAEGERGEDAVPVGSALRQYPLKDAPALLVPTVLQHCQGGFGVGLSTLPDSFPARPLSGAAGPFITNCAEQLLRALEVVPGGVPSVCCEVDFAQPMELHGLAAQVAHLDRDVVGPLAQFLGHVEYTGVELDRGQVAQTQ
jgi:hypothetical protein